MEKGLIIKLTKARKDHMFMQTSQGIWEVSCVMGLDSVIFGFLGMIGVGCAKNEKFLTNVKLNNLHKLVNDKFSIRVDQTEEKYTLIISKDKCSTSFSGVKENGITKLLIKAEDWAKTLLEDLQVNTSCGL